MANHFLLFDKAVKMTEYVGRYVKIISLPDENYGAPIEEMRQSALGRVCHVIPGYSDNSNDRSTVDSGFLLVDYAVLSRDGVGHINFYVHPHDVQIVSATEEIILLYSDNLWELIEPFGEHQGTETFKKLVSYFGYSVVRTE